SVQNGWRRVASQPVGGGTQSVCGRLAASGQLIVERGLASRPSGEWNDDDFDVLRNGVMVGRIMKAAASPVGSPWLWTYGFNPPTDARLRADARGCYGGVREELAAGVSELSRESSIQLEISAIGLTSQAGPCRSHHSLGTKNSTPKPRASWASHLR